jgi:hypothetical protein
MKKLQFVLMVLLAFSVIGCCDDKDAANACTASSINDVPWIRNLKKSMTNCSCEISLTQGTYQSQTVFFIVLTDPLCNGIDTPTRYDCEGKTIRSFTTSEEDQQELADSVTRDKVIYLCKD